MVTGEEVFLLLEDLNACSICGVTVFGRVGGVPRYFCAKCFFDFEVFSEQGEPEWLRFLRLSEKRRRRKRNRMRKAGFELISLEGLYED